jgi:hypothetical protein
LLEASLKVPNQFLASCLTCLAKSFADLTHLLFENYFASLTRSLFDAHTGLWWNSTFRRPRSSGSSKVCFHVPDLRTKLLGSVLLTCLLNFTKRVSQFF